MCCSYVLDLRTFLQIFLLIIYCVFIAPDRCTSDSQCPNHAVCRPDRTGLRDCFGNYLKITV